MDYSKHKNSGSGKGRNKGGSFGVGGYCICLKCGEKIKHQTGVKCTTINCPTCGHTMVREELTIKKIAMKKNNNLLQVSDWKDAKDYFDGTQKNVLRDDENGKTILLKLPKGFSLEPHAHTVTEQHFVLEGQYENDNETFGVGSYQIYPAHLEHGPFHSKNGALILVVWDPIK